MVRNYLKFIGFFTFLSSNCFAADEGMPQLNPDYWVSQIFWVMLIFGMLYIILWKAILPKINENLENRKYLREKEVSEISNRLENIIQEKEYDAIFTHSLEGEYGHQQHKHIHKIVKNLVNKNLFVFGNGDSKLNKNILLKKLELLKIYNSQPIMKYPIFFPWVYNERSNQIC